MSAQSPQPREVDFDFIEDVEEARYALHELAKRENRNASMPASPLISYRALGHVTVGAVPEELQRRFPRRERWLDDRLTVTIGSVVGRDEPPAHRDVRLILDRRAARAGDDRPSTTHRNWQVEYPFFPRYKGERIVDVPLDEAYAEGLVIVPRTIGNQLMTPIAPEARTKADSELDFLIITGINGADSLPVPRGTQKGELTRDELDAIQAWLPDLGALVARQTMEPPSTPS